MAEEFIINQCTGMVNYNNSPNDSHLQYDELLCKLILPPGEVFV